MTAARTRLSALSLLSLIASACADDAPARFSHTEQDAAAPVVGIPVSPPKTEPSDAPSAGPSATGTAGATASPSGPRLMPPDGAPTQSGAGATASGGAANAGASGSAGQSSPNGGASVGIDGDAGAEELPELGDYAVVCEHASEMSSSAQFSVRLSLLNYTDERIPVEQISARYWFSSDNENDPMLQGHQVYIDDAGPAWGERGNVLTDVGSVDPPEDGADTYVEVSFGAGSCGGVPCTWPTTPEGVIAPEQRPIQLRVQIDPAALRYDLSNDYSNDLDRPGPTVCETITLYRDGVLIFGVEPDGTTVEPKTDGGVPPVTEDAGADAGVAGQGGQGGQAGQGGQGGASGADAGGGQSGVVDAGPPDVDASLPEPEPAPLPDAGLGTDASVAP